jgi:ribosomal protein S12 methylthiotransferase
VGRALRVCAVRRVCCGGGARVGVECETEMRLRARNEKTVEVWDPGSLRFFPCFFFQPHQPTHHNRGKFRSKPWDAVVAEAAALVADGALELCLVAEDTNQYGMDNPSDGRGLADLLRELAKLDGLRWIRLLYCYPSYFSEALIDEIASNPKVCKYIDIPLQHVHNLTLLAMARPPRAHADTLLTKLRERIPGLALRTTFICGFPGETDAAHRELVDYCASFRFERAGAFAYSAEDGTPAATLPDQVDEPTRAARRDELIALQQEVGAAFAERLVGTEVDVLIDGYDEDGSLIGRTQWDAPDVDPVVFVADPDPGSGVPPAVPGTMVRCLVTAASLFDLEATPVAAAAV